MRPMFAAGFWARLVFFREAWALEVYIFWELNYARSLEHLRNIVLLEDWNHCLYFHM